MVYLHWAATSENSSANGRSAHTSSACLRRGHFAPSSQYKMTLEIPTCVPVGTPQRNTRFLHHSRTSSAAAAPSLRWVSVAKATGRRGLSGRPRPTCSLSLWWGTMRLRKRWCCTSSCPRPAGVPSAETMRGIPDWRSPPTSWQWPLHALVLRPSAPGIVA